MKKIIIFLSLACVTNIMAQSTSDRQRYQTTDPKYVDGFLYEPSYELMEKVIRKKNREYEERNREYERNVIKLEILKLTILDLKKEIKGSYYIKQLDKNFSRLKIIEENADLADVKYVLRDITDSLIQLIYNYESKTSKKVGDNLKDYLLKVTKF